MSANGQSAQLYRVNDQLSVGAKIIAIYDDYCVLDHGGRLEKLIIPRVTLQNAPATSEPGQNSGLQVIS
jgi:long-subunit fatty acid transport protein